MRRFLKRTVVFFSFLLTVGITSCYAYSMLTHLAIIDASWEGVFLPAIKQRFPTATEEQLKQARAYAYGGAIGPDIGYSRHGNKLFSNLLHYVRTGDFVESLLEEARDINEFAFALGVVSHYYGDECGHAIAVNRSVPLMFPEMQKKFGDTVTYADNKITHLRTEFSFDVIQVAKGNFASKAYHDFIGFQISKPVLERAFTKTYGLDINELFGNFEKAVGSLRWTVKDLMPQITRQAWKSNKKNIRKLSPTATRHSFIYRMRRPDYFGEFGRVREKKSVRASIVSFLFRIAPKIGPLKYLKFKTPTQEAQLLFTTSFDSTVLKYKDGVINRNATGVFENVDWDTGKETRQEEYWLADKTYSDLVIKLKEKKFETASAELKENLLSFYKNYSNNIGLNAAQWQQTTAALQELKMKR